MKDPQQELFQAIRTACGRVTKSVYDDGLPPEKTPYPFIYIGEMLMVDDNGYKDMILATCSGAIHIWHEKGKRGSLSSLALNLKTELRKVTETGTYSWELENLTQQIINDDSTGERLLHCVVEYNYQLLGG